MNVIPLGTPAPCAIPGMVGESRAMRQVYGLIRAAAASDITVLIEGETGTGKELVARAVAQLGRRRDRPFVAINCGAVPESLLDAELFGHRQGAFTGASGDRRGLLEAGQGGTVFLDELTSMSASFQAKLLRVLENAEVRAVGCDRVRHLDLRIVGASNQCLEACVRARQFRADLFYRLSVFPITLPPLRERREDIPLLVDYFTTRNRDAGGSAVRGITAEALDCLMGRQYPGNLRELKNEVARASVFAARCGILSLEHFSAGVGARVAEMPGRDADRVGAAGTSATPSLAAPISLPERRAAAITAIERRTVCEALERHGYNLSRAAAALDLSRFGLRKRMRRLGLDVQRSIVAPAERAPAAEAG